MILKGTFVRIKKIVLEVENRRQDIPEDTKNVPLVMWTKGYLLTDAKIGDEVIVETLSKRKEEGVLVEAEHVHEVNYGSFVPEIMEIGKIMKEVLNDE